MDYDVTYLLGDQEQTDRIAARDAASAASAVQHAHKNAPKRFELLTVLLMESSELESRGGGGGG
ncbi:MAG: hypothetical protein M3Q10_18770, partial [Chloroflexota bacterium]|nr:hypothetical protein [Chloroflexota bacterium]